MNSLLPSPCDDDRRRNRERCSATKHRHTSLSPTSPECFSLLLRSRGQSSDAHSGAQDKKRSRRRNGCYGVSFRTWAVGGAARQARWRPCRRRSSNHVKGLAQAPNCRSSGLRQQPSCRLSGYRMSTMRPPRTTSPARTRYVYGTDIEGRARRRASRAVREPALAADLGRNLIDKLNRR